MRYQANFLPPLKLQKISYYFGLCQKMLLANQFAGFFTFDLFNLLVLILGFHYYIVLVYFDIVTMTIGFTFINKKQKIKMSHKELII